jgi:hypothetical protein
MTALCRWFAFAGRYWYDLPDGSDFWGTGYNNWGVQTNQKFLAAAAAVAELATDAPAELRALARRQALAALRFSLASHVSGEGACTDGTRWGHTWISPLGIERMMYGVRLLDASLTDADRDSMRRVLCSEAAWLLDAYVKNPGHDGVGGSLWNHQGRNEPESNLWNGAICWRAGTMYPDAPAAGDWQRRAHEFLINSVSIPADATDQTPVAGQSIAAWHRGANFFPSYALDHHGYLNVGYMVICASNAAMLHFDMRQAGLPAPQSLYHHQADLWAVLRRMIFADGRLARIGGDTRLRYTYCQEYLLPALLLAADQFGEIHAAELLEAQLDLIEREMDYSRDGGFYSRRLADLAEASPYYYTRLESDRACVLGMTAAYLNAMTAQQAPASGGGRSFESSVAGTWCCQEHGAVMHRGPRRLASFAWRAHLLGQGLCLPPDRSDLAEWEHNLAGAVRFLGDDGSPQRRRLDGCHIETFAGGFATCGQLTEGVGVALAEGWKAKACATHDLAFVALPDGQTVVGMQLCRTLPHHTLLECAAGMNLCVPNDLYNDFCRRVTGPGGPTLLLSPAGSDCVVELGRWACIDGLLGAAGIYGADSLVIDRSQHRRAGKMRSLYVEQFCWGRQVGRRMVGPSTAVLDCGWLVASAVDAAAAAGLSTSAQRLDLPGDLRGVSIAGCDGRRYVVVANFGPQPVDIAGLRLGRLQGLTPLDGALQGQRVLVAAAG